MIPLVAVAVMVSLIRLKPLRRTTYLALLVTETICIAIAVMGVFLIPPGDDHWAKMLIWICMAIFILSIVATCRFVYCSKYAELASQYEEAFESTTLDPESLVPITDSSLFSIYRTRDSNREVLEDIRLPLRGIIASLIITADLFLVQQYCKTAP